MGQPRRLAELGYVAKANQYAADVLSGKIPACEYVKLACQRYVDDLANDSVLWQYKFDVRSAERPCAFAELLSHTKGPMGGQRFKLEPWQCFIVCNLFGWVKKETGKVSRGKLLRRFRKCYIEVPKGNGKSFLVSVIALYMLALDSEPGAEIYSAATTKEQARVVFDVAQEIARKCPKFLEKYGVEVAAHAILLKNDRLSIFKALASEADSLEGKNPHFAGLDELHVQAKRDLYENLESAMAKRDNNLMLSITTAGSDRLGICYEVRTHLLEAITPNAEGTGMVFPDETLFGIVYTLDEKDDWTLEENWIKANPNWGISVETETFIADGRRAIFTTHKQPSFLTKHLNIWVNADNALISVRDWQACYTTSMDIEDFHSDPCVVGLDLASKLDLAAAVKVFSRMEGGKKHIYLFGKYWLPHETIEKSSNPKYEGWARGGYLERSSGATNDFDVIEQELKTTASQFDVKAIAFDPWNAKQLGDHMMADGATMVEVRPLVQNFSPALKELLALIAEKRIHHNGDPVMAWAMSNVIGHTDANENIFPRKERPENKIDPVVALLMALCLVKDTAQKRSPTIWV